MGAVVARELHTARAASRVARLRGRGAERARLDWIREAVRASRRHRLAARLRARPRGAAPLARGATGDRRLARSALRALLRRLHGAGRTRVPATAVGGGD